MSRDPNRIHWLMEVAMEEPIRCQGSFIDTSRLYMLQVNLPIVEVRHGYAAKDLMF